MVVSDKEYEALKQSEDDEVAPLFSIIVIWRRGLLQGILFTAFVNLILRSLATKETLDYYSDPYYFGDEGILTPVGTFSLISSGVLSTCILILGVSFSLYYRFNLERSSSILRWFCVVALVLKLWPVIVQSDEKFDLEGMSAEAGLNEDQENIYVAEVRFQFTVKNIIDLLPLIIAFPRGMLAASMSAFALKPDTITPKILLIYFSPFATMLLILGSSSVAQVAGGPVLASALVCFFLSDILLYFSYCHFLAGDRDTLEHGMKAKARFYTTILGILILLVWFCWKIIPCGMNAEDPHCIVLTSVQINTKKVVTIFFRFLNTMFLAKVIFMDLIILSMLRLETSAVSDLAFYSHGKMEEDEHKEENDDENEDEEKIVCASLVVENMNSGNSGNEGNMNDIEAQESSNTTIQGEEDENVLKKDFNKEASENNEYTNISDNNEGFNLEREDEDAANTSKDTENQVEPSASDMTSSATGGMMEVDEVETKSNVDCTVS